PTSGLALAIPWLLGRIIEALRGPDPASVVPPLALGMIGFAILQAVTRIGSRIALFNAARMAEADLRSALFSHLLTLEPGFYRRHPVGDVMSRLTSDVQTVRAMWGPGLLNLVNTTLLFAVALVLMLGIDPWLTMWAVLPYPLVVLLGTLYGRRIYRTSRAVQEEMGALSTTLQEDLTGIAIIKTYTLEEDRARRFGDRSQRLLRRSMALTQVRGQLMPLLGAVASLGTVVVLFAGGRAVIQGRITLGELVQLNAYLALLVWPTLALGWMISLLKRGQASWRRLSELLETEPQIRGGERALDPASVRGDLSLRGLTIEIDGRALVKDVSLEMKAGTVTAIVGRLGSGKSLLVEAIPRLIDVPPGSVFLDGHDVTELPLRDLRAAIAYAPQDAFLFSATIADNIRVGLDARLRRASEDGSGGGEEDRDELRRAAVAAGLERDLAALPDGLDTMVGERGVTLSGGQRQRVALARALVAEPRVLILDDSLSSVDAETERDILGRLEGVMRGRTAILISHRVAAVRRADQIAVMDGGRLVELGRHEELLARGGVYAELYRDQLGEQAAQGAPAPARAVAGTAAGPGGGAA
ncbi:MAG TPA: ABC transporter ATP-binding protein, partial [Kofleriaceae bacterium]|nr:ABC transporter ATP-binding protein [Kofleriaceae bacterium]